MRRLRSLRLKNVKLLQDSLVNSITNLKLVGVYYLKNVSSKIDQVKKLNNSMKRVNLAR